MRSPYLVLLFLFFTFLSHTMFAQQDKKHVIVQSKPGHIYFTIGSKDSLRIIDQDMTEMVDIIVEYKDDPMFIIMKDSPLRKLSISFYQAKQAQFTNDLSRIYERVAKALSTALSTPQKKREYYKVFLGVSLRVPRAMISELSLLPYVKHVYKDEIVRADMKESVKIIGADSVWSKYGDEGDSVRVGVIDTGIDYMHPALGGGIGKGFKVIGGYDFVNKDSDPMDDHGHGTHVAGIIAGSSAILKGIAPKALIIAYKVLNADGNGYDSDIISAVEACADPNGDGNMDDMLDVVNMSLGNNSGNPFDALTAAVNNAIRLGITFCIGAGNSGDYGTIGSPGTADLAITVGASDKTDKLAPFSSKGPVKKTYIIKPEVLAPGVLINSCIPNSKYATYSGTSMATPMVTGICALLKHKHKDWTPQMIKSALISSSINLGYDIMSQGAGRVNALKAINVKTFAISSQLNFRMDNCEETNWIKKDTVQIINGAETDQYYTIDINGLQNGISIVPDLSSFILKPRTRQNVVFTLSVNNNIVPYTEENDRSYSGKIQIKGNIDTLFIPWAFVKSPVLALTFSKKYLSYGIYNNNKFYPATLAWNQNDSLYSEILLPKGKYAVIAIFITIEDGVFNHSIVVKNNIDISGYKSLVLSPDEAPFTLAFNGVDESGKKLEEYSDSHKFIQFTLQDPSLDFYLGYMLNAKSTLKASPLPEDISIYAGQFQADTKKEKTIRILQFPVIKGMSRNIELKNSPDSFFYQNITLDLSSDTSQAASFTFSNRTKYIRKDFHFLDEIINDKNWKGKLYLMPDIDSLYGYSTNIYCFKRSSYMDINWNSGPFRINNEGLISIFDDNYSSKNGAEINFGDGPIIYTWDKESMPYYQNKLYFYVYNRGKLNDYRDFDMKVSKYTIYDKQDKIVQQDNLYGFVELNVPNGQFREEIASNLYTVAGKHGQVKMNLDLTIPYYERDLNIPPAITQYSLLNSTGTPVSILKKGENAQIVFSENSFCGIPIDTLNTKIYIQKDGANNWENLAVSERKIDNKYGIINTVPIGKYTDYDSTFYNIKIVVQDNSKRVTEITMKPAFVIGIDNYTGINEQEQSSYEALLPKEYKLYNNYPNPFNPSTTISYCLPKEAHVKLKIYDMLGREVTTLVNKEQSAGKYNIRFNASSLPSGIYLYKIDAGGSFIETHKMVLMK